MIGYRTESVHFSMLMNPATKFKNPSRPQTLVMKSEKPNPSPYPAHGVSGMKHKPDFEFAGVLDSSLLLYSKVRYRQYGLGARLCVCVHFELLTIV